ncbi:MAG: hypothetical protein IT349_19275 [Candidatus Eisenbacteria bacterium]|nr:hypothetical protein [Candidatus Eisenbacteria bacterium]
MAYRTLGDLKIDLAGRLNFSRAQLGDTALSGLLTSFLQSSHELLYWEHDWRERQAFVDVSLASGAYLLDYPSVFSEDQRVTQIAANVGFTDPGPWVAATNYSMGDFRRPTTPNGLQYEVTADAGSSHATTEPTWPTTIGETVVDQGITWTCRAYSITSWTPMTHGIDLQHYNTLDMSSYPNRYELKSQIEVTPRADHAYILRVWGVKDAEPFVEDDHRPSINDRLVFFMALAGLKSHFKQPDAVTIADQFKQMYGTVKAKNGWTRSVFSKREANPLLDDPYTGKVPLVRV